VDDGETRTRRFSQTVRRVPSFFGSSPPPSPPFPTVSISAHTHAVSTTATTYRIKPSIIIGIGSKEIFRTKGGCFGPFLDERDFADGKFERSRVSRNPPHQHTPCPRIAVCIDNRIYGRRKRTAKHGKNKSRLSSRRRAPLALHDLPGPSPNFICNS
jgi:hypothetical protein